MTGLAYPGRRTICAWVVALLLPVAACATTTLERVVVAPDSRSFMTTPSAQAFVPWGFNYDHDSSMSLIEEYWESEWGRVEEDFAEMKSLGANVVRVHLQLGRFMDGPAQTSATQLLQLRRLLGLCECLGLRLDITGLACYRAGDTPAWYAALDAPERWRVQAAFWEGVAGACAGSPAVFCYDLINEPLVPSTKQEPGSWLAGRLGEFHYMQKLTLDPQGRPVRDTAREWTRLMTTAIRRKDAHALITVGLIPKPMGYRPGDIVDLVDFLSVHIYPDSKKPDDAMKHLRGHALGKPVVVEEMFILRCGIDGLARFIEQSRGTACGWIGFYWGRMTNELKPPATIGDALLLSWLEYFQSHRP